MRVQQGIQAASVLDLINTELPPNPMWIDPILPKGALMVFGGEAKIGKSFIMLELARALSTGTNPFDYSGFDAKNPCRVLYVEQEIGEYGLQSRVRKIMEKEDTEVYGKNLFYVTKVPELQLDSQEGRGILFDLVDELHPNVVMLDPIGRLHGYNENDATQIQQLFTNLELLIKTFKEDNLSIIFSHHFVKPSGNTENSRDPLDPYNFRGSGKFKDNPDGLITMQKLEYLNLPHKAWKLKVRFEVRQSEGLPDMLMNFNEDGDLRVKFKKVFEDKPVSLQKLKTVNTPKAATAPQQLRFN